MHKCTKNVQTITTTFVSLQAGIPLWMSPPLSWGSAVPPLSVLSFLAIHHLQRDILYSVISSEHPLCFLVKPMV